MKQKKTISFPIVFHVWVHCSLREWPTISCLDICVGIYRQTDISDRGIWLITLPLTHVHGVITASECVWLYFHEWVSCSVLGYVRDVILKMMMWATQQHCRVTITPSLWYTGQDTPLRYSLYSHEEEHLRLVSLSLMKAGCGGGCMMKWCDALSYLFSVVPRPRSLDYGHSFTNDTVKWDPDTVIEWYYISPFSEYVSHYWMLLTWLHWLSLSAAHICWPNQQ